MRELKNTCRAAIVQATPVMFDKARSLEKALRLMDEAARNDAELIVFPELFLPGYPYGMTFGFTVGSRKADGRQDWKSYYDNSLLSDGPEMQQLIDRAAALGVYLSMGYSERDAVTGTLYNSNMMIAPDGRAMNHRKLKPTGSERVVWGDAQQDYFPVMDTPWGPMASLICWESYMPLARVALYQKGISLYISPNTNDNPEWQNTIRHIAIEGHCYFVNADLIFRREDYPETVSAAAEIAVLPDIACRGGRAKLLLVAKDAGDHTFRRARSFVSGGKCPYICVPYTKDELGDGLGCNACALCAFTDPAFAKSFLEALGDEAHAEILAQLTVQAQRVLKRRQEAQAHRKNVKTGKK